VPLTWLARQTIKAGEGAATPAAGADAYLIALSYDNQDGLLPLLDHSHRAALLAQWRAYRAAMDNTKPFRLDYSGFATGPIAAGHAEVRADVAARWWSTDSTGATSGYRSQALT